MDGTGRYQLGALAEMANVTTRIIAYYTNFGERTASDHRYSVHEALENVRFIEVSKQQTLFLEIMKEVLAAKKQEKQSYIGRQVRDVFCNGYYKNRNHFSTYRRWTLTRFIKKRAKDHIWTLLIYY